MPEDRIVVEKTKTYQQTSSRFRRVGPVKMVTPRGEVHVEDVPGFTTLQIDHDGKPYSIAVLVYEPEPGRGQGMIVQMGADSARAVAGSLMMLADRLEKVETFDA